MRKKMTTQETEKLTAFHMERVGLLGWKLGWLRRRNPFAKAGHCSYKSKTISLQPLYVELNSLEEVTNTILHEIAHALVPPRCGHNRIWKKKAIEIGCNGQRCYSNSVITKK